MFNSKTHLFQDHHNTTTEQITPLTEARTATYFKLFTLIGHLTFHIIVVNHY